MSTRTVTVTTTSTAVAGYLLGVPEDVIVANTGTAAAYLDDEPQGTTTHGLTLSAGSSVIWEAGTPLWVVAPSSTTLNITSNGGNLFDAGAIASQILAQGLASQIATAINVAGVPAIESATTILNVSFFCAANTTPAWSGGSPTNCARYQSLRMYFTENYSIGVILPPRSVQISWFADAAGTIPVGQDSFNIPTGTNAGVNGPVASALVSVPSRGPYFTFSATSINGDSTSAVVVVGSYRPAQDLKWSKLADGFTMSSGVVSATATGAFGGLFAISSNLAVGTVVDYPILPGGDACVNLAIGATTGNCDFNIKDTYSARILWRRQTLTSANVQGFVDKIILPNSPISITCTIAGGVTTVNLGITSVDKA